MASIPIKKRLLALAQCSSTESLTPPVEESVKKPVCSVDSAPSSSHPSPEFIGETISEKALDQCGGRVYNCNNQKLFLGTSSYGTSIAASGAEERLVDVKPPLFGKFDPSEKSAIWSFSGFHEPQGTSSENYGRSWTRQCTETCESQHSAGGLLGLAVNSFQDHSRVAVKLETQDCYLQGHVLDKQQNLQLFNHTDPCTETDSLHERMSWDLNTTMDTWEGSMSETALTYKTNSCLGLPIVHQEGNQETGTVPLFPMKADEIGLEAGIKSVTTSACSSVLSKLNVYAYEENFSGTSLDLQLKQPRPEIKLKWDAVSCCSDNVIGGETSDLSLSLASYPVPGASGVVESDPNAVGARKVAANISEELPISACSSNARLDPSYNKGLTCDRAIKSEPHEGPLQDCSGVSPDKKLQFHGLVSCFMDPCCAQAAVEAGESRAVVHASIPATPKEANASPLVHRDVTDNMNLLSESPCATAVKSEHHEGGKTSECQTVVVATDNSVDSANTVRKAANATNSRRAGHTDYCQDKEIIASGPEHSVAGSSGHDKKIAPAVAEVASEASAGLLVESLAPRYKRTTVAEPNRIHFEGKLESSADALEVPLGNELEMDSSHGACGGRNVVHRIRHGHDDYEDGELRDAIPVRKNGREQIRVWNGTKPVPPEGVAMPKPPDKSVACTPLRHAPEPKLGDAGVGIHVEDSKVRISSNAGNSNASLSASGSSKKTRRKESGQEDRCPDAKSELENAHSRVAKGKQVSAYGRRSDLPAGEHMTRKISAEIGHVANHESKRERLSMDMKPRSACEEQLAGRLKSNSARSRSGQFGSKRSPDKFLGRREHRYGGYNDRFKRFRGYKNQDRCFRSYGSETTRATSKDRSQSNGWHGEDSEPEHRLERFDNSNDFRYPWPGDNSLEASAFDADCSARGAGRDDITPLPHEDPPSLSRLQYKRRSPADMEGIAPIGRKMAGHPTANASERCGERDVPGFLFLVDEGKLVRTLPDGEAGHPLQPHPRQHFSFMRERSLSPVRRSGPPMNLAHERSRLMSQQQHWSPPPPRLSPGMFDGHLELTRCRSSPIQRFERMRSPHRRPCFPEDAAVRRPPGIPLHMTRLPEDARADMLRRQELTRPGQMNVRRFGPIDLSESAEEEYLEQLHYDDRGCEVDKRKRDWRGGGLVHPLMRRMQFVASEDGEEEEEDLHLCMSDGSPRPFQVPLDVTEGFPPDRAAPREFHGHHIRDRPPINVRGRRRGIIEEQGDIRGGWPRCGTGSGNLRIKRRRM